MSGSIPRPYLIKPKPELVSILGKEHSLTALSILESHESLLPRLTSEEFDRIISEYIVEMKMVFLLNIIMQAGDKDSDLSLDIIQELFGTSPEYTPDTFDKWWLIDRINLNNCYRYGAVLRGCTASNVSLLGISGYDDFDNRMKMLHEHKKQENQYNSPTKEIEKVYVIKPKRKLVNILGEEHFLTVLSLWDKYEDALDDTIPETVDSIRECVIETKMIFLLNIIMQAHQKDSDLSLDIIQKLFGTSPEYTPATFDKWWLIDRIKNINHIIVIDVYRTCTIDDLNLLGQSGYSDFDNRMKMLHEHKQQNGYN